jgi:hypothetical protein
LLLDDCFLILLDDLHFEVAAIIYSAKARGLLEMYRVGDLVITGPDYVSLQSSHADLTAIVEAPVVPLPPTVLPTVALANPRGKVPCRLVDKKSVSDNVRMSRKKFHKISRIFIRFNVSVSDNVRQ